MNAPSTLPNVHKNVVFASLNVHKNVVFTPLNVHKNVNNLYIWLIFNNLQKHSIYPYFSPLDLCHQLDAKKGRIEWFGAALAVCALERG